MRKLILAVVLFAASVTSPPSAALELPPAVLAEVPELRLLGSGKLTWLGLHIYDASLWVPGQRFDPAEPFALILRYGRDFDGGRIAERSVQEIKRLGLGDASTRARWGEAMRRLFPDIRAGETLTGVYRPGQGAEFFHQERALGTIADAQFARAFFAIWLDPRTREPRLRERLIGAR